MFARSLLMLRDSVLVLTRSRVILFRLFASLLLRLLIGSIVLAPFPVDYLNCWAGALENGSVTEKENPNISASSPEKLYEAVSGYLEGLHRRRPGPDDNSQNRGQEKKRDLNRIVIEAPDKSGLVSAELDLARRRVQRGEFDLASQALQRAEKIASVRDKEFIKTLATKVDEMGKTQIQTLSPKQPLGYEKTNAIGMKMVLIPAGSFRMGSSVSEIRRIRAEWNVPENLVEPETPDHKVEISRPFFIGKYDVTVGQFKQFIAETGYQTVAEIQGWGWGYDNSSKHWIKKNGVSWENPGFEFYDDYPVTMVSHADAEAFCNWLSSRDGLRYTLPTETQCEYSARGGRNDERFPWGNSYPEGKQLNMADRNCVAPWADRSIDDGHAFTSPVGSYEPNGYKLYDIAGNVWQLCSDYFDSKEYKKITGLVVTDPSGPKTGKKKVVRGGSWAFDACEARNAFRFGVDPKLCADMTGFRVVTMPDSRDRDIAPVSPDLKINAPITDEQVNAIFERVGQLVKDGKRLQARDLVARIPVVQRVQKGCLGNESGFVKNVLNTFIDQNSNKSLESFTNSLGMRMVRIPEGSFVMGSSEADISWAMNVLARSQPISLENEYPFHKVRISKPFLMSTNPVTVEQFKTFVNETGYVTDAEEDKGGQVFDTKSNRFVRKDGSSWRNPGWQVEPNQPVTMITYNDATAFCEWLAAKEEAPYKLPTEAQWEYAARDGYLWHSSRGVTNCRMGEGQIMPTRTPISNGGTGM